MLVMGEYANDQIRADMKRMFGFDPGPIEDEKGKRFVHPVYERVKCPHCDAKPKVRGLKDHLRDVHGIKGEINV
jgi:hypothetical protein